MHYNIDRHMKTLPRRFKNGFQEGTTATKNGQSQVRASPLFFERGVICLISNGAWRSFPGCNKVRLPPMLVDCLARSLASIRCGCMKPLPRRTGQGDEARGDGGCTYGQEVFLCGDDTQGRVHVECGTIARCENDHTADSKSCVTLIRNRFRIRLARTTIYETPGIPGVFC